MIKKIKEDFTVFFDDIDWSYTGKSSNISTFISKAIEPGIRDWSLSKFKKYSKLISKMVKETIPNINNRIATNQSFRKLVIQYHGEDSEQYRSLQNTMSLDKDEAKENKIRTQERVDEKNSNQLVLDDKKVEDFIRLVATKSKPDVIDKIILLQVVSGGRSIEILSSDVAEYEEVPGEPDSIKQIGVAKAKGVEKSIIKPILIITAPRFMAVLKEVRANIKDVSELSNTELTNRYNARLNERIQMYLKKVGIPEHKELKSTHGLRRLYINYAFKNRSRRGQSLASFIKKYLGHDGFNATANYSILIDSASVLTENQAQQVTSAQECVRGIGSTTCVEKRDRRFKG